jgi:RNA polymerase sigma factor (sigma-70 family)
MFATGGRPVRGTAAETEEAIGHGGPATDEAGRRRAALELVRRHDRTLKRTARRYSICAEDAEDSYQRGLEILLTKAPTERPRELLAWTTTVIKHEALAVRRARERLLGTPATARDDHDDDWLTRCPSADAGPLERLERREEIARSREAIRALKPAERRALGLLAEGYSYAEIGEITGFSQTKVNRSLAEGRERFRRIVASSEDGSRCAEMRPLLSAFCDGEAGPVESGRVREHLRSCGRCRATMRAYRATPATVAALCPLPVGLASASGAHGGAAGGAKGGVVAGLGKASGLSKVAALQKAVALCAVTATGACVAAGVVPLPSGPTPRPVAPQVERLGEQVRERLRLGAASAEPGQRERPEPRERGRRARGDAISTSEPVAVAPPPTTPSEAPAPAPEPVEAAPPAIEPVEAEPAMPGPPPEAGGAAGEFGP